MRRVIRQKGLDTQWHAQPHKYFLIVVQMALVVPDAIDVMFDRLNYPYKVDNRVFVNKRELQTWIKEVIVNASVAVGILDGLITCARDSAVRNETAVPWANLVQYFVPSGFQYKELPQHLQDVIASRCENVRDRMALTTALGKRTPNDEIREKFSLLIKKMTSTFHRACTPLVITADNGYKHGASMAITDMQSHTDIIQEVGGDADDADDEITGSSNEDDVKTLMHANPRNLGVVCTLTSRYNPFFEGSDGAYLFFNPPGTKDDDEWAYTKLNVEPFIPKETFDAIIKYTMESPQWKLERNKSPEPFFCINVYNMKYTLYNDKWVYACPLLEHDVLLYKRDIPDRMHKLPNLIFLGISQIACICLDDPFKAMDSMREFMGIKDDAQFEKRKAKLGASHERFKQAMIPVVAAGKECILELNNMMAASMKGGQAGGTVKTGKKMMYKGRERCIYKAGRKQYLKIGGVFVPVSECKTRPK